MKVVSSLKSLKKRDLNNKLVKRKGKLYVINKKKSQNESATRLMDIKEQKKTWDVFTKFVIYVSAAVILILAGMAIFLL